MITGSFGDVSLMIGPTRALLKQANGQANAHPLSRADAYTSIGASSFLLGCPVLWICRS